MANPEHVKILKQGVEVWNRWRIENPTQRPSLRKASLRKMNLDGINLRSADIEMGNFSQSTMTHADLSHANLRQIDLDGVNLRNSLLKGADLRGAYLHSTMLIESDLQGARLQGANLISAKLTRTNLNRACFHETFLVNTDMNYAKNLESCYHKGPSTIDHRTLMKSGKLPLAFLRGCGLPEHLIEYMPSLLSEPIQLYSVFISYSHKDEAFTKRLHDTLQSKGVRCWYAPKDIQGGRKIHEQIDKAIRVHDKLLLVLSDHSMNSEWVETELANARRREVSENKRLLFPIRLVDYDKIRAWTCFDADTGKDSAREIREYFIPDFSNWKDHDAFEQAFERLLRDLKADDTKS